jgi:hypothetical protein
MLQPTATGQQTIPPPSPFSGGEELVHLKFEIHAWRKEEQDWTVVARLRHEDDAKAALWAIVFTGQYAAVTVRCEGVAALVAEWPAGLSGLR